MMEHKLYRRNFSDKNCIDGLLNYQNIEAISLQAAHMNPLLILSQQGLDICTYVYPA